MTHNEIAETCRKVLVEDGRFENEEEIPVLPWDRLIYLFAEEFKGTALSGDAVKEIFRSLVASSEFYIWTEEEIGEQLNKILKAAEIYFGSWDATVEAAGFRTSLSIGSICRGVLVEDGYFERIEDIPINPWLMLIWRFSEEYYGKELSDEDVADKFRSLVKTSGLFSEEPDSWTYEGIIQRIQDLKSESQEDL